MNGISHKQAIQLIYRRLDGLLNEDQRLLLDEHLRSCDSCRTYATDIDGFSAHLQNEFHRRWDGKPGPSQNVMPHVMAKAGRIPLTNRISSGAKLFAGAMALIVLAFAINFVVSRLESTSAVANATETVDNASRAEDRLLAFTSDRNGNFDIYTMHADGSRLTNLTNHPANDATPIWSPDGKHIAFESDRNGFKQIFIMDTDGSDVIQITKDEANHTLPLNNNAIHNPWSPDGSRLIFVQEESDGKTATLYVIDIDGKNKTTLGTGKFLFYEVSWSSDGKYIGYVINASTTQNYFEPDIYVINSDGSNLRELKGLLQGGEQLDIAPYSWSSDGHSIVFVVAIVSMNDPLRQMIYELDLQTNTIVSKTETKPFVDDLTDEISLKTEITQGGTPYYLWMRSDGTSNIFEASKGWSASCSLDYTRSPQNNFAFGVYCPSTKFNLYWTNSDGSIITQLLTLPIDLVTGGVGDIAWSADDRYIAFSIESPDKTDMYVLDVEQARANPSVSPVQMPVSNSQLYTIPSWQPVHIPDAAENPPELKIDPQSCKPASELSSDLQPPSELYGYDLVQGTSFVDGDFSYEFWLYCDPSLQPEDEQSRNTIAGLGILSSWHYTGPSVEGPVQYYYGFDADDVIGKTSWEGPLYNISVDGAKFGIDLPKATVQASIQQRTPVQFRVIVASGLGQNRALLSFHLEQTERGLRIVDLRAEENKPAPDSTPGTISEKSPPIGTGISNGEWIAFIGGEASPDPVPLNQDVYMVHPDGSGLVNLTQSPAYYFYLQWSPDGQYLSFIRNTADNTTDIMMHHVGETNPEVLASTVFYPVEYTPNTYFKYSWSPDSKQIAFLDKPAGNYDIYTIDADGSNEPERKQLTNDPGQEIDFAWSPDGSQIAYQRTTGEQLSIMVMNADGSNQHEVARGMGSVSLSWSVDGTSIYVISLYQGPPESQHSHLECEKCVVKPAIYRIDLSEQSVQQIYSIEDPSKAEGWYLYDNPQNMLYFMRMKPQSFLGIWGTWFRTDGNSLEEIGGLDPQQTCKTTTGNILNEHVSPNSRFSIISNFCAGGFDLYLADREAPSPQQRITHLLRLPLNTWGQGGDNATLPILWSPDGRWLVYDDGNQSVYILDIEQTLRDPTTEPVLLFQSDNNGFMFSELAWQPKP